MVRANYKPLSTEQKITAWEELCRYRGDCDTRYARQRMAKLGFTLAELDTALFFTDQLEETRLCRIVEDTTAAEFMCNWFSDYDDWENGDCAWWRFCSEYSPKHGTCAINFDQGETVLGVYARWAVSRVRGRTMPLVSLDDLCRAFRESFPDHELAVQIVIDKLNGKSDAWLKKHRKVTPQRATSMVQTLADLFCTERREPLYTLVTPKATDVRRRVLEKWQEAEWQEERRLEVEAQELAKQMYGPDSGRDILNNSIGGEFLDKELSKQVRKQLLGKHMHSWILIGTLVQYTETEFLNKHGVGPKVLAEVRAALERRGLRFGLTSESDSRVHRFVVEHPYLHT